MKETQTPRNLMVLYNITKKMKGNIELFRLQLSSNLLDQEMNCIIIVDDIMQFATI